MTAEPQRAPVGVVVHLDLTVPNAEVVGWRAEALDMGGYSDFVMLAGGGGRRRRRGFATRAGRTSICRRNGLPTSPSPISTPASRGAGRTAGRSSWGRRGRHRGAIA
ncbi:MAG: hypothetical protein AVDCRST_MAG18-4239 [uncultured Thermomicrobiales bacterium]|uniref:Uncharacterized protein n=1 Tax=uncultured Thermomicrobiales bacterium TaxID=1645740 RepID=A0A6J4VU02_9BACT|nr:MAG: hypothetical protein AVDCRST_MAG18-4239 [uncultured Thermomicrobiales bacterium]